MEATQVIFELWFGLSSRECEWYDAVNFANKLSEELSLSVCYSIEGRDVTWLNADCSGWRLPTEAEWEYLARGGEEHLYSGSNSIGDVAWYDGNSGSKTHPVGQKQANGFGLYDMSGNVNEWTWDWKVILFDGFGDSQGRQMALHPLLRTLVSIY